MAGTVNIPLDSELAGLLGMFDKPVSDTARELIVLELYRQGRISSGKAGELLDMPRFTFVKYASQLGIPFLDMTEEEWQSELAQARKL
jgi:predicted HTH domain antitoxin